jgi:hypothetical protein
VPAVLTEGFWVVAVKPPGPDQEYVAFGAFVLADTFIAVTLQVSVPPVAEAVGGVVFPVTVTVAEFVHPVRPSVTTTVYVPAKEATGLPIIVLLKPIAGLQRNVESFAFVVVFNWAWALLQPSTPPVADIVGGVVFPVIFIVSLAIQRLPPAAAVTVKMTVPGCVTISVLPVPRMVPFNRFQTLTPLDGVVPRVIVSLAQDKTESPNISAIGSNTNKVKLMILSQPW